MSTKIIIHSRKQIYEVVMPATIDLPLSMRDTIISILIETPEVVIETMVRLLPDTVISCMDTPGEKMALLSAATVYAIKPME
jgi:hypothetical protein